MFDKKWFILFNYYDALIFCNFCSFFCVSYHVELSLFGLLFKYLDAGEIIVKTKKQRIRKCWKTGQ